MGVGRAGAKLTPTKISAAILPSRWPDEIPPRFYGISFQDRVRSSQLTTHVHDVCGGGAKQMRELHTGHRSVMAETWTL